MEKTLEEIKAMETKFATKDIPIPNPIEPPDVTGDPIRDKKLESLYWRIAWLQFFTLMAAIWGSWIFNPDLAQVNFLAGVSIQGFSVVILGGMIKLFNKQLDIITGKKLDADKELDHEHELRKLAEDKTKSLENRIADLEGKILQAKIEYTVKEEKKIV